MNSQLRNERNEQVFQMESGLVNKLNEHKQKALNVCGNYLNQHVKVTTVHGEVYEGIIVHIDEKHIYISQQSAPVRSRPVYPGGFSPYGSFGPRPPFGPFPPYGPFYPTPYNPYANVIIPLALFDLLAIALLV